MTQTGWNKTSKQLANEAKQEKAQTFSTADIEQMFEDAGEDQVESAIYACMYGHDGTTKSGVCLDCRTKEEIKAKKQAVIEAKKETERLAEAKKQTEVLRVEREKREKIEREIEAEKEAERLLKEKEEEDKRQALLAPDKDKLIKMSDQLSKITYPRVESKEAGLILDESVSLIEEAALYLREKAKKL